MNNNKELLKLVITAFLIAIEIILTRYLSIQTPIVRIGFGFLPVAVCGIVCGPLWAGLGYALGDIIGVLLAGNGTPHPGFTLSALLTGLVFGFILYKKEITIPRIILASAIVVLGINLCLDTYWLSGLMGKSVIALLPVRAIKAGIMLVVQPTLIFLVSKVLLKIPVVVDLRK